MKPCFPHGRASDGGEPHSVYQDELLLLIFSHARKRGSGHLSEMRMLAGLTDG